MASTILRPGGTRIEGQGPSRQARLLCAGLTTALAVASSTFAADVPIVGRKLVVVDKTVFTGKAHAVFVSGDAAITKGSGTDPADIEATLDIAFDSASGAFDMPRGTNWLVNSVSMSKYVNGAAPTGGAVKLAVLKPGVSVKVVGRSSGDAPLDISVPPSGPVYVVDTVVNGGDTTRLCTQFARCVHKVIARGTGYKLICRGNSTGDPDCTAGASPTTTATSTPTTSSTSSTVGMVVSTTTDITATALGRGSSSSAPLVVSSSPAMRMEGCPALPPGISEALEHLPPGLARRLTDDLERGKSDRAALRRLLRDYPAERVRQWRQDPGVSRAFQMAASTRQGILAAAGDGWNACLETEFDAAGVLTAAVIDVGDRPRFYYELCVGGLGCPLGRYRVNTDDPNIPDGSARVTGTALGHDVLADSVTNGLTAQDVVALVHPNAPTTGTVRTLVVGVHLDGGTDPLLADLQSKANTLRTYANADSEGSLDLRPTVYPSLVNLGAPTGCDVTTMANLVRSSIVGWTWRTGDHLLLVGPFAKAGCTGWSGLGSLGAWDDGTGTLIRYAWLSSTASACTWWHEATHNLGLHHSGSTPQCFGRILPDDPATQCPFVEYGALDVMGSTAMCLVMTTWQRQILGWLPGQLVIVTPPRTITLRSQTGAGTLPRAACISRGRADDLVCVQARRPIGRDANIGDLTQAKYTGAEIKLRVLSQRYLQMLEPNLGDPLQGSASSRFNLPIGSSVVDPVTGITIRADSETTDTLTVSFLAPAVTTVSSTSSSSTSLAPTTSTTPSTNPPCLGAGLSCSGVAPCCFGCHSKDLRCRLPVCKQRREHCTADHECCSSEGCGSRGRCK